MNSYTNEFDYSQTGKILRKNQKNTGLMEDTGETVTIAETTYDWTYEYSSAHPNAVTKAGPRSYGYDLNGNMTAMTVSPLTPEGGTTSMTRTLVWDEENRLLNTTDRPLTPRLCEYNNKLDIHSVLKSRGQFFTNYLTQKQILQAMCK